MDIPPGVAVKAAQSILPLVLSRGLSRHTTASTPSGACPGVPAAWSRRPHCDSYGKYSLSETDYLRRTCSDRRMTQMGPKTATADRRPNGSVRGDRHSRVSCPSDERIGGHLRIEHRVDTLIGVLKAARHNQHCLAEARG